MQAYVYKMKLDQVQAYDHADFAPEKIIRMLIERMLGEIAAPPR